MGHLTDHRLLVSLIRSLFVPHRTETVCAVQKLEDIASLQRVVHSKVNPLLQAADTLGMAAALQGDTQNGVYLALTSAPNVLRWWYIATMDVTSVRGTRTRLLAVDRWKTVPSLKASLASRSWCCAVGLRMAIS